MAPVLQSRRTDPHTGLTIAIVDSLGNLARRLRRALGRTRFERQLDAELRFHVDAECAELVQRGVEPGDARRQALAALGGMDRWREEARDTRATTALETLLRDVRLSLRSLLRSPSYTLPVVATLALGIGAMASIATLAYDVLFRPLPYRNPGELVALFERNVPRQRDRNLVSPVAVEAWRQRSRTLDSVSVLMPSSRVRRSRYCRSHYCHRRHTCASIAGVIGRAKRGVAR